MRETIGQYKILDRVGIGGIGEVFRARDTRAGRTVAIKMVDPPLTRDPERKERFLHVVQAVEALSHPNIATLYEFGEDQGQQYLAFEYVPGETLKAHIGGRPLNPRRALDLAIQLADALAEVHGMSLIHGDIKPDNVIVTPKGNAKLLDCGLAEWTAGGAARDRTARAPVSSEPLAGATFVRTVPYMSPEQIRGESVDYRSDIFSLGAMIFEMLTGKPPYAAATPTAVARQIAEAPAPAPTALNPGLPREVDAIVGRCLAPKLDDRYESAATLAAELRSLGAILDVRSGTSEPPAMVEGEPERRSTVGWALAVAVLALAAAIVWLAMRG